MCSSSLRAPACPGWHPALGGSGAWTWQSWLDPTSNPSSHWSPQLLGARVCSLFMLCCLPGHSPATPPFLGLKSPLPAWVVSGASSPTQTASLSLSAFVILGSFFLSAEWSSPALLGWRVRPSGMQPGCFYNFPFSFPGMDSELCWCPAACRSPAVLCCPSLWCCYLFCPLSGALQCCHPASTGEWTCVSLKESPHWLMSLSQSLFRSPGSSPRLLSSDGTGPFHKAPWEKALCFWPLTHSRHSLLDLENVSVFRF